jgi:hypothetical protein
VIWSVLALVVGSFGGGYLHYYAMLLLQEHTDLQFYSWNDQGQGTVLRLVFFGDFAIGAVLVGAAVVLITRRGFRVPWSLLLGFGASIMAYTVMGMVLCMLGC